MKKLITLVVILFALAAASAVCAGFSDGPLGKSASGAPRLLDGGDGGGCHIGDTWYAGGHHYICTNWNGVGLVVEIP